MSCVGIINGGRRWGEEIKYGMRSEWIAYTQRSASLEMGRASMRLWLWIFSEWRRDRFQPMKSNRRLALADDVPILFPVMVFWSATDDGGGATPGERTHGNREGD